MYSATKAAKILSEAADQIVIEKFQDGTTKEYKHYDGCVVKQADVNLLAHPLDIITDKKIIQQDLEHYPARFDERGPAMVHSILSVIASRLGNKTQAW